MSYNVEILWCWYDYAHCSDTDSCHTWSVNDTVFGNANGGPLQEDLQKTNNNVWIMNEVLISILSKVCLRVSVWREKVSWTILKVWLDNLS